MDAYKTLITNVIQHLKPASKNFTKEVEAIYDLERMFANVQIDDDLRRNSTYKNMTIRDLAKQLPEVN